MTGKKITLISKILLFLVATIAVFLIWKNGGVWYEEIHKHQWNLNIGQLVTSAVLLTFSLVLTPSTWVLICRSMGSKVPGKELFAAWYSSQLGRYIPGKIWLFAGRAGFLKANGMKIGRAAATTVYELFFSVASIGLIVIILALTSPEIFQQTGGQIPAIIASSFVFLLPLLHPVQNYFCRRKGIDPDFLPTVNTTITATLIFSSLWLIRGLSLFLLLKGAGLNNIYFSYSVAAAPLSWLAGYVAFFVPGGIGVREAAAAAIAAPLLISPAAVVIAGQRIFMAIIEVFLALLSTGKLKFNSKQEE